MSAPHLFAMRAGALLLFCAAFAGPAAAQDTQAEFDASRLAGWSFTPGFAFGTLYDSNVALSGPDVNGKTASDSLFNLEPFGQLEFFSPRTRFSSGYRGALRRYFDLNDLDGTDHRAYLSVRHRLTRRVSVFADESYARLPTTDMLELNGVPFVRVGSRYNTASGGVDARLTKSLDLSTHYDMSWVDFEHRNNQLTGGVVHGIHTTLTHRFSDRISAGGEYGFRWATLNQGLRQFTYQDVGGVVQYRSGERTMLSASGGLSHLLDRVLNVTRTSPYIQASVRHQASRALFGAEYGRSYAPSFFLGGSHQSQDARGYIDMPFSRNRLYVQESVAWRRTDPFLITDPALNSTWIRSALGYSVQRWIRAEGYYQFTAQDNRLPGGQIRRHLVGAQLVVSEPMRIR